jgi:general secretion pathway protein L
MSILVLSLPPGGGGADIRAPWALVGEGGDVQAEGWVLPGAAAEIPQGLPVQRVIALMPAQDVFVRYLAIPGRSDREAAQAAPFLIEEDLAAPLDTQHVAIGARNETGEAWLFATSKHIQASWRDYLSGLGLKPVYALPDAMLLNGHGGDLTLAAVDGVILFQTRAGDLMRRATLEGDAARVAETDPICGGIDAGLAEIVLPALGQRMEPRRMLISPDIDPGIVAPDGTGVALKRQPAPDLREEASRAGEAVLAGLPAFFGTGLVSALDWKAMLGPWVRPALLAGAAILLGVVLLLGEGIYYGQRADTYYQAARSVYSAEFDERATDPAAQLRVRLRAAGGGPDQSAFLDLAAGLAAVMEEVDTVAIQSLRYTSERGGLSVTATYPDFSDFETFRAAAQARGLVIEEGGARQGDEGVTSDFLVRRS